MPLDAVCLQAVVAELAPQITGSRIEKIQQPARDQVVLLLRGNRRLLLSAGGGQPRLHLTELPRDNPAQPPMFCMLLRKYLSGGIIESIQQAPLERVVTLTVSAADELGERSQFSLILEAVARRANLILADKDGHIIDCLRRIDFEMNPDRQVLPGLFYHLPTPPDKVSPFTATEEEFAALAAAAGEGAPADQWLVRTVNGLSPLVARELTFRACGSTDAPVTGHTAALWSAFAAWRDTVNEKRFTPVMLKRSGVPMDFTYLHVGQYGGAAEEETYTSFSRLLDDFYEKREQAERVKQKGQDLVKTASNGAARLRRKIAAQEQELAEAAKAAKTTPADLKAKIESMLEEIKALHAENDKLKSKLANSAMGDVMSQVVDVAGVKVLATRVADVDMNGLRNLGDQLKEKLGEGVIVIASVQDGKVNLMATATDEAQKKGAHAGNLIKAIAGLVGGGGGGRPNMAQAGGKNPAGVDEALVKAVEVVKEQVQA